MPEDSRLRELQKKVDEGQSLTAQEAKEYGDLRENKLSEI